MTWTRRRLVAAIGTASILAGCVGDEGGEEGAENENGAENEAEDGDQTAENPATDSNSNPDTDLEALREAYEFADRTGEDVVEIAVDPAEGRFDPVGVEIDAETTLAWSWEGTSEDLYPIAIPDECMWEGTEGERTAGDEYDRVFWAEGGYVYGSRDADGEEFTGAIFVHEGGDEDEGDEE